MRGTAGFLISAYKYILKVAQENKQNLTPKERKALTENIQGYDISPDMVKLALVNMYLHKFKEPKIYEYDTLTETKKWDDYFDCILANPPFMTPKGGIQPHNKFAIKANRSEVLFVDYIMEHLNSTGRAGIIVPEGIVFQSANAYKQLRKELIDGNYLYAVVSLPSGIFNPYSGVKTSILFIDKTLAKKTDKILFVEIQNDGFDLGAQRRQIDKNDLPKALELINSWQNCINTKKEFKSNSTIATVVEKTKLAENEEYNLTASRYKETKDYSNCKYKMVKLEDICDLQNGYAFKSSDYVEYSNTLNIRMSNIRPNKKFDSGYNVKYLPDSFAKKHSDFLLNTGDVIIAMTDMATETKILGIPTFVIKDYGKNYLMNQRVCRFINIDETVLSKKYLSYVLQNSNIINNYKNLGNGGLQINIGKKDVLCQSIPLPPIEIQKQIVKELDGYQAVIDGAQKVIDNWEPTFQINPNWQKVKLGEICDVRDGTHDSPKFTTKGYPLITSKNLVNGNIDFKNVNYISKQDYEKICKRSNVDNGDILYAMIGTIGNPVVVNKDRDFAIKNVALFKVGEKNLKLNNVYLKYILEFLTVDFNNQSVGGTQKFVSLNFLRNYKIPLPTLEEQNEIVSKIEQEEKAIEECKKLIKIQQEKINSKLQSIWGN